MKLSRTRFYGFSGLLLLSMVILAACGDPTATTAPAATPTVAPTTAVATTLAPTTAAAAGGTTAASGTRPAATPTAPLPTLADTQAEAGRVVFAKTCAGCHLGQGQLAGRAPQLSVSQNAINADFVRQRIRTGSPGKMPAFDQTKVSDADIESIILYLKAIHKS